MNELFLAPSGVWTPSLQNPRSERPERQPLGHLDKTLFITFNDKWNLALYTVFAKQFEVKYS